MHAAAPNDVTAAAAARIATRLLERMPELLDRLADAYRTEDPQYGSLPDSTLREEVLPVSETVIAAFLTAVSEQRAPTLDEARVAEEMATRRLAMGVGLDAMLHVFRIGGRAVFQSLIDSIEPGEELALGDLGVRWMDFIDHVSSLAASAYLAASHDRVRHIEARRNVVIEALLGARDASDLRSVAAEFSIRIAELYAPVVIGGEEVTSCGDGLLAASTPDALVALRGRSLLLLAPNRPPDESSLRQVVGRRPIVIGRAAAPGPDLRAEVEQAETVLRIAGARGEGCVLTVDSYLIEQVAEAAPRILRQLRDRVIDPIAANDRGGLLLATLRTYLETGSVAATADREAAHPNTVTHRLRRILTLTGLNPRVPTDAAVLVLALRASGPAGC